MFSKSVLAVMLLFGIAIVANAQDARSYDEGAVIEISYIRVHDGEWDNYMKYLSTTYKTLMEGQKEAGIIIDWGVYGTSPRSSKDHNLLLTVRYTNMAALDGLEDKTEPVMRKIHATRTAGNEAYAARGTMRTVIGSELIREIKLR